MTDPRPLTEQEQAMRPLVERLRTWAARDYNHSGDWGCDDGEIRDITGDLDDAADAIEALVRRCGDAEAEIRAHAKWAKEFTATDEHGKLWLDMIRQRDAALARAERAEAERDEARRCAEGMRNRYANALATYRDHWSTAVGDPAFAASQEADMETDLAAVHRLPWERPASESPGSVGPSSTASGGAGA